MLRRVEYPRLNGSSFSTWHLAVSLLFLSARGLVDLFFGCGMPVSFRRIFPRFPKNQPPLLLPFLAFRNATMNEAGVKCAPSKNLNVGFTHFATAKELYAHL